MILSTIKEVVNGSADVGHVKNIFIIQTKHAESSNR